LDWFGTNVIFIGKLQWVMRTRVALMATERCANITQKGNCLQTGPIAHTAFTARMQYWHWVNPPRRYATRLHFFGILRRCALLTRAVWGDSSLRRKADNLDGGFTGVS